MSKREEEIIRTVQVDPLKIVCIDCRFKNMNQEYPHYTKGTCGIYTVKPNDIMFNGASCDYYVKEEA